MFQQMLKQNHFAWGLITPGKDFNWQSAVKRVRVLRSMYLRVLFLAVGRLSPMWVTCVYTISRTLLRIAKSQGLTGLVKYCKVLSILTQQAAGGYLVKDTTSLGCRVSRTSAGLPRIINKAHRASIRKGNAAVLRMYLSIFGLYRVVEIPGKVKIHTITALCLYRQADLMIHLKFVPQFFLLLARRVSNSLVTENPNVGIVREVLGYKDEKSTNPTLRIHRILPITTAGPLSSGSIASSFRDPLWLKVTDKIKARMESCNDGQGFVIGLWRGLRPPEIIIRDRLDKLWGDKKKPLLASSVGTLWFTLSHMLDSAVTPYLKEWAVTFDLKPIKTLFKTANIVPFGQIIPWGTSLRPEEKTSGIGKLGFLEEAAGKVRVVAMVDPLTQSMLRPLHDWLFSVLRRIPEDGTFDQTAPIELLIQKGVQDVTSYDLSAATDRLPLSLQENLIGWILGEKIARTWASLLVNRDYSFHPRTAEKYGLKITSVRYAAGQPMGAYSSWAMLALTHHFCVQLAAYRVYGNTGVWFSMYAVLGDDVVIADRAVALAYRTLMCDELRVDIQETKSLISNNGTFEFAKRTILRGIDATPISLKGFIAGIRNLPAMEGILAKIPGIWDNRLANIARSLGYGYKVTGRLQAALQRRDRLQGLIVFLTRPGGLLARDPLSWISQDAWNSVGCPPTEDSVQNLYREIGTWAGEKLLRSLENRKKLFARDSKAGGWIPTTWFPTRVLFDVYQNLVLRPISEDLQERISQLELLMIQWKGRTDIRIEDFNEFLKELDSILREADSLPRTPKVARLQKEKILTSSSTLKLWRRLRTFVKKD